MANDVARAKGGRWAKGQSGNPVGRPRQDMQVRELARAHTEASINTLVTIQRTSKNDMARLRAAEILLNRGYGQPTNYVETTNSLAEEIDKIKLRSKPTDSE
jgi:hypothetical protein